MHRNRRVILPIRILTPETQKQFTKKTVQLLLCMKPRMVTGMIRTVPDMSASQTVNSRFMKERNGYLPTILPPLPNAKLPSKKSTNSSSAPLPILITKASSTPPKKNSFLSIIVATPTLLLSISSSPMLSVVPLSRLLLGMITNGATATASSN